MQSHTVLNYIAAMKSLCNKIFEEALKDMHIHTYHVMSSNILIFKFEDEEIFLIPPPSFVHKSKFTEKCVYSPNTLVKYWLKVFILQFIICIASDFPPSFVLNNLISRIKMLQKKKMWMSRDDVDVDIIGGRDIRKIDIFTSWCIFFTSIDGYFLFLTINCLTSTT